MVKALNQEIARKFFASLILDFEYPDVVICRVLIDGYFCANLTAANRQAAIEKFNNTSWRLEK